jgi:hypothetical protein
VCSPRPLIAVSAGVAPADALIVPSVLIEFDGSVEPVAAVIGIYTLVLAMALAPGSRSVPRQPPPWPRCRPTRHGGGQHPKMTRAGRHRAPLGPPHGGRSLKPAGDDLPPGAPPVSHSGVMRDRRG